MSARFAAVDLGASSGRVMAAEVRAGRLELREAHRFGNGGVRRGNTLHWDLPGLYREVLTGLGRVAEHGRLDGIGVDSWGVDYGLLDATDALLGDPVHYRDARTDGVAERVHAVVPPAELYATTGVQFLPFTTIYQLAAETLPLTGARLLLLPDLIGYWLTGQRVAEMTNSSTTGLLDVTRRAWADGVLDALGLDRSLFGPLVEPGHRIGEFTGGVAAPVYAVGSHDTASAVAGIPAQGGDFAFIATGTWSLVGVELPAPVLGEAGRLANFSNELGVDGTVRYLRNVMGLWLLQECLRAWGDPPLAPLLAAAAAEPPLAAVVDAASPEFIAPGDMPGRIAAACRRTGQRPPQHPAAFVRCILDSLALAHRRAVRTAAELTGRSVEVVHVVGGGARNELLCRLTADACGLPVIAGPVEAAAYGNALGQARAAGAVSGGLAELRAMLRASISTTRYPPRGDEDAWARAAGIVERSAE